MTTKTMIETREADLALALNYALRALIKHEPGDSRAVSNEFVAMASIQANLGNEECREILRAAIAADDAEDAASYGIARGQSTISMRGE